LARTRFGTVGFLEKRLIGVGDIGVFVEKAHGFAFESVKAPSPGQQFVEVDLQAVELGAVHAGKSHLCHPQSPGTHRTFRCRQP